MLRRKKKTDEVNEYMEIIKQALNNTHEQLSGERVEKELKEKDKQITELQERERERDDNHNSHLTFTKEIKSC